MFNRLLIVLHADALEWVRVTVSGPPPPGRLDHAMCPLLLPVMNAPPPTTDSTPGQCTSEGFVQGEGGCPIFVYLSLHGSQLLRCMELAYVD